MWHNLWLAFLISLTILVFAYGVMLAVLPSVPDTEATVTIQTAQTTPVTSSSPQTGPVEFPYLLVLHDESNSVTCWALVTVAGIGGLDCMPDSDYQPMVSQ